MGVKIIPEWSEKMIPKEKTNNEGKTETADPPRWKNNHIKAFSTSPKGMLIPSAVGQNKPETFTGSHRNKKKKQKLEHSALHTVALLPCANLPHSGST